MKHIFIAAFFYLVGPFATQAVIFGDEDLMKEGKGKSPSGGYQITVQKKIISDILYSEDRGSGTATYYETEEGKYFGLTCAHVLRTLDSVEGENTAAMFVIDTSREGSKELTLPAFFFNNFDLLRRSTYTGEYDLLPMSLLPNNEPQEKNKIYVEPVNDKLKILFLAPTGEKSEGMLDILINKELTPDVLDEFKEMILKESSLKGWLQSWDECVRDDLGIFSLKKEEMAQPPYTFKGSFYDGPLIDGEEYDGVVASCGPIYDNQLNLYQNCTYHEAPIKITYNAAGYFTHSVESREFSLFVSPSTFEFNILPNKGEITTRKGDSGGVVKTQDGKALAMVSGLKKETFPEFNQFMRGIDEFVTDFLNEQNSLNIELTICSLNLQGNTIKDESLIEEIKKNLEEYRGKLEESRVEFEKTLLQKFHATWADEQYTKKLPVGSDAMIYRFTLNKNLPLFKFVDYFTPLKPHKKFIETFINQHK